MKAAAADCAVFVTHIWSPRIERHFLRLRQEAGSVLPVFLAFHQHDERPLPVGMRPDIVVRTDACAQVVPFRYADHVARQSDNLWGYVDMVWLTIFLSPSLVAFDRLWLVEYDVDFSGAWSDFFAAAETYEGDILTAGLRSRSEDPSWYHWPSLVQPNGAPADPLAAFMPISRFSRQCLTTMQDVLAVPGWSGHFEAVWPSAAIAHGLSVAEIGGDGPRVPAERRGKHYSLDTRNDGGPGGSNRFLPNGFSYFEEAPSKFPRSGWIYHPIKVEATPDQIRYLKKRRRRALMLRLVPQPAREEIRRVRRATLRILPPAVRESLRRVRRALD